MHVVHIWYLSTYNLVYQLISGCDRLLGLTESFYDEIKTLPFEEGVSDHKDLGSSATVERKQKKRKVIVQKWYLFILLNCWLISFKFSFMAGHYILISLTAIHMNSRDLRKIFCFEDSLKYFDFWGLFYGLSSLLSSFSQIIIHTQVSSFS